MIWSGACLKIYRLRQLESEVNGFTLRALFTVPAHSILCQYIFCIAQFMNPAESGLTFKTELICDIYKRRDRSDRKTRKKKKEATG
jgi:hypothetical protein